MSAKPGRERILLVDDERTIVDACTLTLARSGYQVRGTTVAAEVINLALQEPPDLLLCDLVMPSMNGLEVLRTIKHLYPDTAAVMITGFGSMQAAIEALQAGADNFLLKPFSTAQLRRTVEEALAKRRTLKDSLRLKALMPLYESSRVFHSEIGLDRLATVIVEQVAKSITAHHVALLLPQGPPTEHLQFRVGAAFPADTGRLIAADAVGWVSQTREPLTLGVSTPDASSGSSPSTLYVPLQTNGDLVGILQVQKSGMSEGFSDSEEEMVAIQASQAAIAIKNALLVREIEDSYLQALGALANALDARDPGTFGHTDRVSRNAVLIATTLGLQQDAIEQVRMGALVHDIGKVGVADAILQKPGKLTDEEYAFVKQHPITGDRILAPVPALQKARTVVLHHHERYDGSGYPHGLSGDRIPLPARVVAVADAFDAVTEARVYHPGHSIIDAFGELRHGRGTQFDPLVVDAFFDVLGRAQTEGKPQPLA